MNDDWPSAGVWIESGAPSSLTTNCSGEGGAAIMRRQFGESRTRITTAFPHWFAGMYTYYRDRENACSSSYFRNKSTVVERNIIASDIGSRTISSE